MLAEVHSIVQEALNEPPDADGLAQQPQQPQQPRAQGKAPAQPSRLLACGLSVVQN